MALSRFLHLNRTNSLRARSVCTSLTSQVLLWIKGKQEGNKGMILTWPQTPSPAEFILQLCLKCRLFYNILQCYPIEKIGFGYYWGGKIKQSILFCLCWLSSRGSKQSIAKNRRLVFWAPPACEAWHSSASCGLHVLLFPWGPGPFNIRLHPSGFIWGRAISFFSYSFLKKLLDWPRMPLAEEEWGQGERGHVTQHAQGCSYKTSTADSHRYNWKTEPAGRGERLGWPA